MIGIIQRLIREGEFPKPRQLSGRRVAWLVREVEHWTEQRPVSNLAPPANTSRGTRRQPANSGSCPR
ncbi:AlpA family transcriptional regulator [Massilia sp. 9I]|uniref:helix-turn-helix transcriptional regulator n=1 Tax=Massilia sp. 9I TaxID=2653152 RepID=UPI0013592D50|nr:AlpA family phage regulatory protein [Massilia sp. 9I]